MVGRAGYAAKTAVSGRSKLLIFDLQVAHSPDLCPSRPTSNQVLFVPECWLKDR